MMCLRIYTYICWCLRKQRKHLSIADPLGRTASCTELTSPRVLVFRTIGVPIPATAEADIEDGL